jgi:ABC-type transport system involved in multi-copper enzyme maturation permease subunit
MIAIIRREFLAILRTPWVVPSIVAAAGCFAALVLWRWPATGLVDFSGAQAREVFRIFALGLFAGVLLLVPAIPATSIVRERRQGTLLLLLDSPLSPASIYFGKLLAMLLFAALLACTSLPAMAACYAMGGIDLWRDVFSLYAVLGLLTVECIALGLLISTFAQSTDSAVRLTYAAVFTLCFLTLGPHILLRGQAGWKAEAAGLVRGLSPLPVMLQRVGLGGAGSQGLVERDSGGGVFFLGGCLLTLGVMAFTLLHLNHRLFDRARSQGAITDEQSGSVRALRRLFFIVDPQRRSAGIPDWLNPVMVKEFRTRRFGRLHWLLRLIAVFALASLLITFAATTGTIDWGVEAIGGAMVLLQVAIIVVIAPSLASGLISTEVESRGWELLRMTPLSTLRIVTGKLASVALTTMLVLLATLPGYAVMMAIRPAMWLQVSLVMVCLVLTVVVTLAVGAAVGSLFSRTATATVVTYAVLMAMFLGPLLVWSARERPFGHEVVESALSLTPLGAALSAIRMPGFGQYDLIPWSWRVAGIVTAAALVILGIRVRRLTEPS